jgi:2'-5' RNA ligase
MRVFIGIDLDSEVRSRIDRFIEGVSGFAPEARWVSALSLHITLKFIGEQTAEQVDAISRALGKISGEPLELRVNGYGFFPTAKAPRVFWIGVDGGTPLATLAASVYSAVAELGIAPEERAYNRHLTLARGGRRGSGSPKSGSPKWSNGDGPNLVFTSLQARLAGMGELDFGTITANEFILYQSQLSPAGSKYTKLRSFELHGG